MAYHPQGDGQTERINQELEQFLRFFINQRQDDWDDLLPLAEFQYNNHIHSATQNVPFLLDTGRIPRITAGMGLLTATENGWEINWSLFEFPNHLHR